MPSGRAIWLIDYEIFETGEITQSTELGYCSYRVLPACPANISSLTRIDFRTDFTVQLGSNMLVPELEQILLNASPVELNTSIYVQGGSINGRNPLLYHIRVIDTNVAQSLETPDEVMGELIRLKQEGSALYKSGNIQAAWEVYSAGVALMESRLLRRTESDLSEAIVPLYLNQAQCCLKLAKWTEAIAACNQVINDIDKNNVKALFRRALARMENREFGAAKRDLLSALFVDPHNEDVRMKLDELKSLERGGDCRPVTVPFASTQIKPKTVVRMHVFDDSTQSVVGHMDFELDHQTCPRTVENFLSLARDGKYKNNKIFKGVRNQFFQSGDFQFNDGSGGNCAVQPDREIHDRKFFNDECLSGKHSRSGLLGMANYGKDTNGSQFYVTLGTDAQQILDGKHVVFGRISEDDRISLETLQRINEMMPVNDVFDTDPSFPKIHVSNIDVLVVD